MVRWIFYRFCEYTIIPISHFLRIRRIDTPCTNFVNCTCINHDSFKSKQLYIELQNFWPFLSSHRLLYGELHIFKTHVPILMLVAALERARATLTLVFYLLRKRSKNGVKENIYILKFPNSGILPNIPRMQGWNRSGIYILNNITLINSFKGISQTFRRRQQLHWWYEHRF